MKFYNNLLIESTKSAVIARNDDFSEVQILVGIISEQYLSAFDVVVPNKSNQEFKDICDSWDLFGHRLRIENDRLVYGATIDGPDAYEYAKFLSLLTSYIVNEFNFKG